MADIIVPFFAGQKTTADAFNDAFDLTRMKYQGADQSAPNTTLVNSTYLTLSVTASVNYFLETNLYYDANTTADVKFTVSLPSGATVRFADAPNGTTSTSTTRIYQGVAAGTVVLAAFSGLVDVDTTAGDLVIQFAQNTSNATATILKLGSMIRLTQVTA